MSLPLEEKNATPEEESAVSYLFLNNRTFLFVQLLIQMQPTLQLQTGNSLSGEEIGVRKKEFKDCPNSLFGLIFNFLSQDSPDYDVIFHINF